MNKTRVEALSDGVFAIVMTLLMMYLKLPQTNGASDITAELLRFVPLFKSYFFSFAVLTMFWLAHHSLFHFFTKTINTTMVMLNMLYLAFLSVIPFSASLLETYESDYIAMLFYGVNMLVISSISLGMFAYALHSDEIDNHQLSPALIRRARIRHIVPLVSMTLGLAVAYVSIVLAQILFVIPILVNTIPGTITFFETLIRPKSV